MLKYGIANSSGDGLGYHGVERLGVLDGAILGTSGECIRNFDGGDQLIFGENIVIGIASGGDGENAARRTGIAFHLVCENTNVKNAGREGIELAVPWF